MDHRTPLPTGSELSFPGMTCVVGRCIGRGSNAIVYEADYLDATSSDRKHHVLLKELFPFDPRGRVRREKDLSISRDPDAEDLWQMHLTSFQRGNDIHLQLLALYPDHFGRNINTFPLNNTLYTILDDAGSRSLEKELGEEPAVNLRKAANWCLQLLDCLEVFHRQNYLHLDISLDNILLVGEGERERIMLTDYNSVHSREEIRRGEGVIFSVKEGFTAPETQTGMYGDISFCTDLYSVAAVFYATLTGSPPSMIQLNRKNPPDARESPLLMEASPAVREQVRKILRRGLCTLPDKRYQSCAYMKQDLAELIARLDRQDAPQPEAREAETESGSPQVPEEGSAGTPAQRSKARGAWVAAVLAVLVCAVCAYLLWIRPQAAGKPADPAAETASMSLEELLRYTDTDRPDNPDYSALLEHRQDAAKGDAGAMFSLGVLYEAGTAVEQNYQIARQYYLFAAKQNHPEALLRLGIFYQFGLGVAISPDAALDYYQQAADHYQPNGWTKIGSMYLNGVLGERSVDKALEYYRKALDKGDPEAAYELGCLYRDGQGVEQSFEQAARLYETAAEGGIPEAAEALGDLYSDENSGITDPEAAARYYQMAVDMGLEPAREKLDRLKQD